MMSEPKPLASLSAGLLARKGAARPAMRRQVQLPGSDSGQFDDLGWNDMGYEVDPQDDPSGAPVDHSHSATIHGLSPMTVTHDDSYAAVARDLDAAADAVHVASPAVPEVRLQQQAIASAMSPQPEAEAPSAVAVIAPTAPTAPTKAARSPRARAGSRGNFAFTLRLDPKRHLRLRIASATTNHSTQQILIGLVDDYLKNHPEIDAFAAQLPASGDQPLSDVA